MRSAMILFAILTIACGGGDDGGDDGVSPDANTTAPDSDPGAPDASPNEGITCGDETCDEATQECCVAEGGGQTCVATGTCTGTAFGCDGPEDCTVEGEICCGMGDGAHCQMSTECAQPVVCQVDDDCPNEGELCCMLAGDEVNRCLEVQVCPGG